MKLLARILAAIALACAPAIAAAQDKPLVAESHVIKTLPSGKTLDLNASVTGAASLNVPCSAGVAPTSPADGDMWCTSSGYFVRVGSTTVGPLGAGGCGTFVCLSDVPGSYTSQALKIVRVNSGATALEFHSPAFTDLSGAASCGQLPALTGDVTTSGCAATLAASGVSAGTYGDATHVAQVTVDAKGRTTSASSVAISGSGAVANIPFPPQGRLTLTSGSPVMSSDATAQGTIYYDCFNGGAVPYYDGTNDRVDTISSCEVSLTLESSGTGVENATGVFDVFWFHNSGSPVLCTPTNGSGGGWASDTGGSNTARGTGYSQLNNVRGYWTNKNSIPHCYNGTTDYGSIAANAATYLGSYYTTAAGQTGMQFAPAAASGGSANVLGLYNAYNRVLTGTTCLDTVGPTGAVASTNHVFGNGDTISYVDGLATAHVTTSIGYEVFSQAGQFILIYINKDSTSAGAPSNNAVLGNGLSGITVSQVQTFPPSVGLHFLQAMYFSSTNANTYRPNEGALTAALEM